MLIIWTQSTEPENTNGSWWYIVDHKYFFLILNDNVRSDHFKLN